MNQDAVDYIHNYDNLVRHQKSPKWGTLYRALNEEYLNGRKKYGSVEWYGLLDEARRQIGYPADIYG